MAEGSICRDCFHSYVCEQFNENKDANNKKCLFFYDHFVPTADVVEVVRCKDCIYNEIGSCTHSQKYDEDNYRADYFCADGTPKERGDNNG